MRGAVATLSAVVTITAASAAFAADIHVPGDFRNLQKALDAARPGDRILLDRGTWRGTFIERTPGVAIVGGPKARLRSVHERDFYPPALKVLGDGVTVRGLTFLKGGIQVQASDVVVEGCTFRRFSNPGSWGGVVAVVGDRAVVTGNSVARDCRTPEGILIMGEDASVTGNTVQGKVTDEGITVLGAGGVVEGNDIAMAVDGNGIRTSGGAGAVVDNRVERGSVVVFGDGGLVRGNSVADAGLGTASILLMGDDNGIGDNVVEGGLDTGVLVRGDRNLIAGNSVTGNGTVLGDAYVGHGIVVRGSGNSLLDDTVDGCIGEAFRIVGNGGETPMQDPATGLWSCVLLPVGPGNDVTGCTGTGAGTCGLGNWTPGTTVDGSTFTGNAIDVVGGTEFQGFDGNTWETGGPDFAGTGAGQFTNDTYAPFFEGGD